MRIRFLLLLLTVSTLEAQEFGSLRYAGLVAGLKSWASVPVSGMPISGLVLRRDVGTFFLEEGSIAILPAVGGVTIGAWFEGKGRFTMRPPSRVERDQLARFAKVDAIDGEFTGLLIVFTDSTAKEIRQATGSATASAMPHAGSRIGRALLYLLDDDAMSAPASLVESYLNNDAPSVFDATMMRGDDAAMFFGIDPFSEEEVSYGDPDPGTINAKARRLINQFDRAEEFTGGGPAESQRNERAQITRFAIDCTFDNDLSMVVRTDATFSNTRAGSWWVPVELDPALRIDSVRSPDGGAIDFVQTGSPVIWVRATDGVMRFFYHGRVLERSDDWILLTSSIGWYPRHGYHTPATFDLTYHAPVGLHVVSIGQRVSEIEVDDRRTTRWVLDRPSRNASFHVSVRNVDLFAGDTLATVAILRGPASSKGISEQIGSDVRLSTSFFGYLFGPLPIDTFYVAEIPAGHGEAFPGLIHLSSTTFEGNEGSGFHELFRAHEVAHQWWGIALGFASYHDQWLSEAFAEYSGLLYMQGVLKDNEKFFKCLRGYRDNIVTMHRSLLGSHRTAGPIWLGYRNNTGVRDNDYFTVIYQKGAWVLHMLRNMLVDLNTMKEDRFRNMMRDFFQSYSGREASTADFRKVVERHAGMPMAWFFDQWVTGTAVPTYRWSWKGEAVEGGKYRIRLKVDQSGVPEDFQMHVPITIHFGEGKQARVRVQVKGSHCEPVVPMMPLEPRRVIFNDFESVLCETEEVDFDE